MENLLFYYSYGKEFGFRKNSFDWKEEDKITSPRGNKSIVYATFNASTLNLLLVGFVLQTVEMIDKNRSQDIQWGRVDFLKSVVNGDESDLIDVSSILLDIADGTMVYDVPQRKNCRDNFDEIMDAVDNILDMMD